MSEADRADRLSAKREFVLVLRCCRSSLLTARRDAAMAAARLYGVRAARASELGEKLADALAFCERLVFVVEGDLRADL